MFKDLDQFLCQFNKATIDLSSQKYLTIAHSRVIVLAIKKDLEANRGEDYLLKYEPFNFWYLLSLIFLIPGV